MDFLKIQALCKSFGGLKAVRDFDLTVNEGEIIGLIGPNGSGKTTTLNLITGFLTPNSGTITLQGKDITGLSRNRVCQQGVARTFQIVKPFLEFTALQNVMVGRVYGQHPTSNMKVAAEESQVLLEQIGLGKKANVLAKDLSLMQRKRLELARALAAKPQLLLLDELLAGLNHHETDEAMKLILKIRDQHITIIMVEHIVKAICGLSDRVVVLNMGEKIAEGVPDEITSNPQVIEVYLGKSNA
jgi:branched-chain amino acid transport system ATP-binding protein